MMVIECATSLEAMDLLHYCLSEGEVRLTKHFREELERDHLSVEDIYVVLRDGAIFEPPELDTKTREMKWRVEGREPGRKWIAIVLIFKTIESVFLISVISIDLIG
jgi:Domain of unknown function (DUF4258)